MDKLEKFDYMGDIEEKLERLEVRELFDDLLKQLLVQRPEAPLDFMLEKLKMANTGKYFFA
jgi:adenylate kinase